MTSGNPYNKINPLSFLIRKVTGDGKRVLFHIGADDHPAFDMCVFRRHLFDYLMDNLRGAFDLWNMGNDYALELNAGWDEQVLRDSFRVV